MIKIFFLSILLILSLISFYLINELNYKKIREIKLNIVEHPENLPTIEVAKNTSFWFANLKANLYWLETIQYIWWNAVSSEYKKYLYSMLNIITELDPYFKHPYNIWTLLLPSYNNRYENLTQKEKNIHTEQAIKIGKKWINTFCDIKKLEAIKNEYNFYELKNNEKFKNPCTNYKIPYNLAFVYFHYLKQPDIASYYYRVAYANENSIEWAKIMASIMKWKWWDREKAFFMFLNMASESEDENIICKNFSKELLKASKNIEWKIFLREDTLFIKQIEEFRKKIFPKKESKDKIADNLSCITFLDKAVRELNLNYIEIANQNFKEKTWENATNAKKLYQKWFLHFLPTDPQNNEENTNIIYYYNDDTKNYDYRSWNY